MQQTKLFIREEQNKFGQKELSSREHWCVALAGWPIRLETSDKL